MTNQLDLAVLVAVLFSAGIYLCLSRRFLRVLFGFLILSNAANLVVLAASGDPSGRRAPVVGGEGLPYADPLPQALVLTAIVIGFAVIAYFILLLYRIYVDRGVNNLSELFTGPDDPSARKKEAGK